MARWIVFSDLHVTHRSLDTCLQVLDLVHEEARKRDASILFLGDFWTERGRLPTGPLNAAIERLQGWTRPAVFLPGNHDQVDLGGSEHGIAPLAAASGNILCFDEPCVSRGALWVPYRRRMEEVLDAIEQHKGQFTAIFCHIDVVGAFMNDAIQAGVGILPEQLPVCPIFTGHYHKPHAVEAAPHIVYVGSPYQVTHHEAGQEKRLLVLDDVDWSIVEEIPIDVGPRHFRVQVDLTGWGKLPKLRSGDRLIIDAAMPESEWTAFDRGRVDAWRADGVTVDLRVQPEATKARIENATDLDSRALWQAYAEVVSMPHDVRVAGEEVVAEAEPKVPAKRTDHVDLRIERVEVEGYGPFIDRVEYPLAARGAVLVTGRNEDMPGSDSNGAGKTTLVMASLWALTGTTDPRPDGNSMTGLGRDMVNHACDNARVTVRAVVNGAELVVTRSMGKAGHTLSVRHDGQVLDGQDVDLTQERLDRVLDTARVTRTVFFGQHETAGFLEATDKGAKEMITEVVPVDLWVAAQALAKTRRERAEERVQQADRSVAAQTAVMAGIDVEQAQAAADRWEADRTAAVANIETMERMAQDEVTAWQSIQRQTIADLERAVAEREQAAVAWDVDRTKRVADAVATVDWERGLGRTWEEHRKNRVDTIKAEIDRIEADGAARARDRAEQLAGMDAAIAAAEADVAAFDAETASITQTRQEEVDLLRAKVTPEVDQALRAARDAASAEHKRLQGARPAATADAAQANRRSAQEALDAARAVLADLAARGRIANEQADAYAALHGTCDRCQQAIDPDAHAAILAEKRVAVEALREQYRAQQALVATHVETVKAADAAVEAARAADIEAVRVWGDEVGRAREAEAAATREWLKLDDIRTQVRGAEQRVREAAERANPHRRALAVMRADRDRKAAEKDTTTDTLKAQAEARIRQTLDESNPHNAEVARLRARHEAILAEVNPEIAAAATVSEKLARAREEQCPTAYRVALYQKSAQEKRAEPNPLLAEVERREQAHKDAKATLDECERAKKRADHDVRVAKELESHLGRMGIQNFVIEAALTDLQVRVQSYLDELSDGYLRLHLSATSKTAKGTSNERLDRKILVRRSDGSYAEFKLRQLSGGQRRRVLIATTLAFAEFCAARTGLHPELVVFDEVFQHLDPAGRSKINRLIRGMAYRTVLVISHDQDLAAQFDHVDTVTLKSDRASLKVG